MALMNEYPVISSNLSSGFGVYGTADPYNAALVNNGALNPPGSLYFIPSPSQGGNTTLQTAVGYCSGLWCKYVLYKSTSNPAMVAGPGIVYYTDETFSTVSGAFAESFAASNPTYAAGFLLPNTGSVAGVGVGSAISATILNNGGLGSYVWIGIAGFIPSAYVAAEAQGNPMMGGAGAFTPVITTTVLRTVGWVWGTVTSNIADIIATIVPF
jgi:hypothetical protein